MKRLLLSVLLAAAFALPAHATMKVGDSAPDFTLQASEAGKEFTFSLADALKKGPVVVYFYPKAFTKGAASKRMISPRPSTNTMRSAQRSSASVTTRSPRSTNFPCRSARANSPSQRMRTVP
jgi:hypothetical protein